MNDKTVNVLEQYDMDVLRTFKGRGTIICDTNKGNRILKEYKGKPEKLELLDCLQRGISDTIKTDTLVRNKEGLLFTKESDGSMYILKEQVDGRECSYKSEEDIAGAFSVMASLHLGFTDRSTDAQRTETGEEKSTEEDSAYTEQEMPIYFYADEMEKHTRECRHVKNYLKKLRVKSDFERALLQEYDYFLEKANVVTVLAAEEPRREYETYIRENGLYCHGDYQYHNVIFPKNGNSALSAGVVNFEHFTHNSGVLDFYLLFRKISEKSDWSLALADHMLNSYQSKRTFAPCEWRALGLRLAYPEKFWKIINFYYNSRKSWMPNRNYEKLESLIRQEQNKEKLVHKLFGVV